MRAALLMLLLALVAACGATTDPTAVPGRSGPAAGASDATGGADVGLRFYRIGITDPAAEGVEAFSFLLPEGWAYRGSVQWLPTSIRLAFLETSVSDPSTGVGIDWLPIQDFIWFQAPAGLEVPLGGNYQGKIYLPPITDPVEFVRQFWVPGTLPHLADARLVDTQTIPAIADEFVTQYGGPATAAAYRLRYEYERDGATWEEDVDFALLVAGTPDLTSWYVNFAYAARAPKGQLDANAGTISTIVASRATTPQWEATYRVVQRLFNQGIQQQMADTQAFGQLLAQHRAESEALQAQVVAERQASQDRIADLRGETLAGVQTYDDPVSGGAVQLPAGFDEYWVNDRGEYLTSDERGFDPNSLGEGTWRRLQPRP